MKSKILKNIIAIMLCMVIVISGSGYLLAESLQEEGSVEVMEASVEDEPAEEKPAEKETTVEVEIPEKKETVEEKKEEEPPKEETVKKEEAVKEEAAETPAAEEPAAETPEEEPAAETPTEESAEPILQLTYEDDDVKVIVDATKAGNIPDGATLSVTPIEKKEVTAGMSAEEKAKTKEINEQYELTEKKLQEKADKEEYDIAGFLAYDITFVDADGNKLEPNGDVKVSMEYKNAVVPEEVKNAEAEAKANNDEYKADVTVMHLEENSNGTVKEVVDMVADANEVATVDTTTSSKVKKAEFVTDSFSTYTVTWTVNNRNVQLTAHYGYEDDNGQFIEFTDSAIKRIPIVEKEKEEVILDEYANTDIFEKDGYTYTNAYISTSAEYSSKSECYSLRIREDDDEYYLQKRATEDAKRANVGEKISSGTTRKIDVYYVYISTGSSGGSGGSGGQQTLDAPTHSKYIKQNILGEDYTLTLDVIGGIGEAQTVDVLMIVDQSGSMRDNISTGKTRAAAVNDAIGSFTTTLQNSDAMKNGDLKVNVAAVVFGSGDSEDTNTAMDWKELPARGSLGFNAQGVYNQGTNWQAGIRKAEDTLKKKANDGNKKVVIFLTDGLPTYRIDGGNGQTDPYGYNYDAAVTEWNASTNLKGCAQKYVIDMYGSTSSNDNVCANFANAIGATRINGTNTTDLTNGFKNIANNIARPAYKNVQIIDTLSQWVEFKDADPTITLKTKDADGNEVIIANGPLSSDAVKNYVTYNAENKTITADLSKISSKLEEGVTYSLSFDVKPTEEAKNYFLSNGYPDTGEDNTDVPEYTEEQYTSSGKQGFFSNTEAHVSYQVNDGDRLTTAYQKPVVQVKENSTELTITKTNSKGSPLAGATFELENDVTHKKFTATTGADGTLTFTALTVGDYTLKETQAPSGYERSVEVWKVKVVTEGDVTTATLYNSDGTTLVENNKIVNYTEAEIAERNLKSSKTATVVDEDNRVFQIDLNASTQGQGAGVEAKGASIVLVLDASSSMNEGDKSLSDIKNAAKAFVDTAYDSSKLSEIAVVWYNGTEGNSGTVSSQDFVTLTGENNVATIKSFIRNKSASGGTPMGDALETAYGLVKSAKNSNKYVLFFTDGMPGYWSGSGYTSRNCKVANKAYEYAKKIKDVNDGNAVVYTVGYQLNGYFTWEPGHSSTSWDNHGSHNTITSAEVFLKDYIATAGSLTEQYAYTTDNSTGLSKIFDNIAGQIGDLFTVKPEKIVDVIDARFELTAESKAQLEKTDGVIVIENEDGTTTIEWTGDAAVIGNEAAEGTDVKGPWSSSFQIQAKPDFIGGNMVPTNGATSGIYLKGNGQKLFEQPSVNVKPLSLAMDNKEIWVYKGDLVEPDGFADELDDTLKILELDGTTTTETGKPSWPTLTEEQKAQLAETGIITINADGQNEAFKYKYTNTNDAVGYFQYTYEILKDEQGNSLGDMKSHPASEAGEKVEQYKLTVEFIPYTVDERAGILGASIIAPNVEEKSDGIPKGGTELDPQTDKLVADGIYYVNVVAGEIQITKILEEPADEDLTFTFEVTDKNDSFVKDITITILAGETRATYRGSDLNSLARGTYKIIEKDTGSYGVQEIRLSSKINPQTSEELTPKTETNCYSSIESPQYAEFTLGSDTNNENVIINGTYNKEIGAGVFGGVAFTNEKIISDWSIVKRSKTLHTNYLADAEFELQNATKTYYGKSDADGKVLWYTNADRTGESVTQLQRGTYTLKETKAPDGYSRSVEEWTVVITHNGALKSIVNSDGETPANAISGSTTQYYYDNQILYELPSAGGPGIFWYTIGGILLMMAAALILYKNKCREVLNR